MKLTVNENLCGRTLPEAAVRRVSTTLPRAFDTPMGASGAWGIPAVIYIHSGSEVIPTHTTSTTNVQIQLINHCKNIFVTSTMHISVISVACVWCTHHEVQGMLPNKSSEDLEIKMLRSFSPGSQTNLLFRALINWHFWKRFDNCSYGRIASNVAK